MLVVSRTGDGGADVRRLPDHRQSEPLQSDAGGRVGQRNEPRVFHDEHPVPGGVRDRPGARQPLRGPFRPGVRVGHRDAGPGHHVGGRAVRVGRPLVRAARAVRVRSRRRRADDRQRRSNRHVVAVHERYAVQLGAPRKTGAHVRHN